MEHLKFKFRMYKRWWNGVIDTNEKFEDRVINLIEKFRYLGTIMEDNKIIVENVAGWSRKKWQM